MFNRLVIIAAVIAASVFIAGCNNTQARYADEAKAKTVTFKLQDKKRNLMGDAEEHTDWMLVTSKGRFNPYYRSFGEMDVMGRPKLYKELTEGQTYRCEVYGQERKIVQHYRVIKNCSQVEQ